MNIDYAAMAKSSAQSLEPDTLSYREGQTLISLCPFERGYPDGSPSVALEAFVGGEGSLQEIFKRTVGSLEQDYVRESAHFQEALGRPVPNEDPLKKFAQENLGSKASKTSKVTYWVVVPLAYRTSSKFDFQEDYTKPKIMTAKMGKPNDPHIQGQLNKIFADQHSRGGVEAVEKLFDPEAQQLLVVERTGKGQTGTKFTVSLAEDEYASYKMSDEILADVEAATKHGGPCDLNHFVATKFFPDAEEIATRLFGAGDKQGMKEE